MRKKVFKIILALLPTILILSSILIALAQNDFNIEETLIDSDDLDNSVRKFQPNELSNDFITTSNLTVDKDKMTISVEVRSPLKVDIILKEVRINVSDGGKIISVSLENETKIGPGEYKIVTLTGKGTENYQELQMVDIFIKFEMLGIIVETKQWR